MSTLHKCTTRPNFALRLTQHPSFSCCSRSMYLYWCGSNLEHWEWSCGGNVHVNPHAFDPAEFQSGFRCKNDMVLHSTAAMFLTNRLIDWLLPSFLFECCHMHTSSMRRKQEGIFHCYAHKHSALWPCRTVHSFIHTTQPCMGAVHTPCFGSAHRHERPDKYLRTYIRTFVRARKYANTQIPDFPTKLPNTHHFLGGDT